jgi:peptidoglycan hydrolase CwlO-like protein
MLKKTAKLFMFTFIMLVPLLASLVIAQAASDKDVCKKEDDCGDVTDPQERVDCYSNAVEACSNQVAKLQDKAATLASEISYMDNQINLTQLRINNSTAQISATEDKIAKLGGTIEDLGTRIDKLQLSIEYQRKVLSARLRERYKSLDTSPVMIVFGSTTLTSMIQKTEYLKVMELEDNKLMAEMDRTKKDYNSQKNLLIEQKAQQEVLQKQLEVEKANLNANKATLEDQQEEKQRLLEATKNDEANYQSLLNEARATLQALTNFVTSAGGGLIDPNGFGTGSGGWYYSQRDSRWGNKLIAGSSYSLFRAGCLITSMAMLNKYYGSNIRPDDIASKSSYFINGDMYRPWKPAPKGRTYIEISVSTIDRELNNKNPVIVGMHVPSGMHFIVLAKKSGNDYIMYDPYYGPDLKFSSRYSINSIFQAVVFK